MDGEVGLVGIHAFHNDGLARQRTPRQPHLDTDGHTWTSDGPLDPAVDRCVEFCSRCLLVFGIVVR